MSIINQKVYVDGYVTRVKFTQDYIVRKSVNEMFENNRIQND